PEDWRGRRAPVSGKAETRRPALRGEVMDKAVADVSWPLAGFPSQGGEQAGSVLFLRCRGGNQEGDKTEQLTSGHHEQAQAVDAVGSFWYNREINISNRRGHREQEGTMKLLFFDDFKLGVLKGDGVVDVSEVVRNIPHTGPHDLINGLIEQFAD